MTDEQIEYLMWEEYEKRIAEEVEITIAWYEAIYR